MSTLTSSPVSSENDLQHFASESAKTPPRQANCCSKSRMSGVCIRNVLLQRPARCSELQPAPRPDDPSRIRGTKEVVPIDVRPPVAWTRLRPVGKQSPLLGLAEDVTPLGKAGQNISCIENHKQQNVRFSPYRPLPIVITMIAITAVDTSDHM